MKPVLLLLILAVVYAEDVPPSCIRPVYCKSNLLHYVQTAGIFPDSKTFVDRPMVMDENDTLAAFDDLLKETNNNPTKEQIETFVNTYFDEMSELEDWSPPDYNPDPAFLAGIKDESLKQFGKNINDIWPTLGRKMKADVLANPNRYSLIPVDHGFIIPGGRFKELYYWDTYWIIEGLLISGMDETVKGVIGNLLELLKKLGHIPNGSRWYYQERSQPPLLSAMMYLYISKTKDLSFLKENINALEEELEYWLDTQVITFNVDDRAYALLRYYAPSEGPRPESYNEDYKNAQTFDTPERQQEFYTDIKSAAESGWDFSSRWFVDQKGGNSGNLTMIHASKIIPVDLNSIFANALQNMAHFQALLNNGRKSAHWAYIAKQWRKTIKEVLWNKEESMWFDWDIQNEQHRKYFYPSNVAPLWMGVVDKAFIKVNAAKILNWLITSRGLDYPGGIPSSLVNTGEQWDLPNAWPPLVSITVNALEALGTEDAQQRAFEIAQNWVRSCRTGFVKNKQMFEKYDAEVPGRVGGGGEYNVQTGFGWSNGVVLEFLAKYGQRMTANETVEYSVVPIQATPSKSSEESASVSFEDNFKSKEE